MFSDRQIRSFKYRNHIRLHLWLLLIDDSVEKKKSTKCRNRFRNTSAMQLFKLNQIILKQHVINLPKSKVTDHYYILLSRCLKFIPNPKDKNDKLELLKDFDELARKMRCRYWFHKNYLKTGYEPEFSCHTLENYISLTKFELSYLTVRTFRDNISKKERQSINNLKRNKQLIIKKADKNGNIVVLDKDNYLSEKTAISWCWTKIIISLRKRQYRGAGQR